MAAHSIVVADGVKRRGLEHSRRNEGSGIFARADTRVIEEVASEKKDLVPDFICIPSCHKK